MISSRTVFITILAGLSALAIQTIWIQLYQNGSYSLMKNLRHTSSHLSPCPHVSIDKHYTGIEWIDDTFTGVECAWGTMLDGSNPSLSLFAFQESGTFAALATLIWTESLKSGAEAGPISLPTLWLMAFNVYGFGVIMPIYCVVHLLVGGAQFGSLGTPSQSSIQHLRFLPLGITLGYIIPTFLSSWTRFSLETHRHLILTWGVYPFLISLTQQLAVRGVPLLGRKQPDTTSTLNTDQTRDWPLLHSRYIFAIRVAALTHVWAMSLMITSHVIPSLFASGVARQFSFKAVLLPPIFQSYQVESLAEGMMVLLQYDLNIGGLASILWALYLLSEARSTTSAAKSTINIGFGDIIKTAIGLSVLGRGATIVLLMVDRDMILYCKSASYPYKKKEKAKKLSTSKSHLAGET